MFDVWGEKYTSYGRIVSFEVGNRDELGFFTQLEEVPDVDISL
jgi:hypothetical protein